MLGFMVVHVLVWCRNICSDWTGHFLFCSPAKPHDLLTTQTNVIIIAAPRHTWHPVTWGTWFYFFGEMSNWQSSPLCCVETSICERCVERKCVFALWVLSLFPISFLVLPHAFWCKYICLTFAFTLQACVVLLLQDHLKSQRVVWFLTWCRSSSQ